MIQILVAVMVAGTLALMSVALLADCVTGIVCRWESDLVEAQTDSDEDSDTEDSLEEREDFYHARPKTE